MLDEASFVEKVYTAVEAKNALLERIYHQPPLNPHEAAEEYADYATQLAPHVADTSLILHEALRSGKRVLCEGAQGTLLDLDHGTYPFVTSSSPIAGGALTGLGFGLRPQAHRAYRRGGQGLPDAGGSRPHAHRITR